MKRKKKRIVDHEFEKLVYKFKSKLLELRRTEKDITTLLNYFSEITNIEILELKFKNLGDNKYEVKMKVDL